MAKPWEISLPGDSSTSPWWTTRPGKRPQTLLWHSNNCCDMKFIDREELLRPNHNLSLFTVIPVDFQLSYLLTMAVITAIAFAPYAIFILFTCYCKVLFQPKNIIKCNFAIATLIFLTGNLIHLLVLYFEFGSFCPDIYLLW